MNWEESGRNSRGLIEVLCRYLSGETEENHENPQAGQQVSRQKFESKSFRIRDQRYAGSNEKYNSERKT
jgi:hypothetical protein